MSEISFNITLDTKPFTDAMERLLTAFDLLAAGASKFSAAVALLVDPRRPLAETQRRAAALTRELAWVERRHRGDTRKRARATRRAVRRFHAR